MAHHFAEAEAILGAEKLVKYSLLAGERALAAYAWEEALDHFTRAMEGVEGEDLDPDRARLLFGLGRAQVATLPRSELQVAVETLSQAFKYYETAGDVDQAMVVVQAYPDFLLADVKVAEVVRLLERALALVSPNSSHAGRLLSRYGHFKGVGEGDYAASQEAFDRALTIARNEKDTALEVRTLVDASRVEGSQLHWQESLEKISKAIELVSQVDDPVSEVQCFHWATQASLVLGDFERAREYASGALAAAERLRHQSWMAVALWTNAPIARMEGDWEATSDFVQRGLDLDSQEVFFLGMGALVACEVGDFSQADTYLRQMLNVIPSKLSWSGTIIKVIPMAARITGEESGLDVAKTTAEAIIASQTFHEPVPLTIANANECLSMIAVVRQDARMAHEHYAALNSVRAAEFWGLMGTDRLLGLLAHTMGSVDQSVKHFEDSLAFCRKGFRPELAWTCCDYADTLLERHSSTSSARTDDRQKAMSLLDESLAISSELGMRPLMERVLSRRDILKA